MYSIDLSVMIRMLQTILKRIKHLPVDDFNHLIKSQGSKFSEVNSSTTASWEALVESPKRRLISGETCL